MVADDLKPILFIVLSASLFGISIPLAKLLVADIPAIALAGLLYLGAFAGLAFYSVIIKVSAPSRKKKVVPLGKKDMPWLVGAILTGGILAPICMMMGLALISGFSVSLLINLEGLATAMIAILFFKENAGIRLWLALVCMTIAGIFLAWDPTQGKFNLLGPLLLLIANIGWGIDNNLTCHIADKDPFQITEIKGLVAGTVALALALLFGLKIILDIRLVFALILGAFGYGISLVFFIKALERLGSARTGAFYSFAPFIGAIGSLIILREWLGWVMLPATIFMIIGVWLIISEKHVHFHYHEPLIHTHPHTHNDFHHIHNHTGELHEPHTHIHEHIQQSHQHRHWPDTHHRHEHER